MTLTLRPALPSDIAACIDLRGRTRENAVSASRLAELGITEASWSAQVREAALPGVVAIVHGALAGDTLAGDPVAGGTLAGYCFGDAHSGEIVVLAMLPRYEGQGLGRRLLDTMVAHLAALGHRRLFLGCSDNPAHRSHGFYRRLGWSPTGLRDGLGDEVLELRLPY
ncbi:GNAT family N-acetyltransferase [Roseateles sp. SL47]|uniref:GNAT family N-acetyltransferase n=1 Tax=Roseateles sp. SL47 TaxID=2995138 RepID=UPI00226D9FE1|nr:GNAT family N-acetyltransferase [Roseateles sp. SL47]WAC73465.1 GNAT family N-acetyltransferase [Roseateles sp. SL47]